MGEREVDAREKSNEANGSGEGGRAWGGQGRTGRIGPGWVTSRIKTHDTHDH
jgi:hypothetical protein